MTARRSSGSRLADIVVEPTRSQNIKLSWRRSAHLQPPPGRCVEFADRPQELAAIAQDDAEILEVLVSQLAQDREVDPVLGKARGVLRHAEPVEPLINLGHRQQSIEYSGSARRKLRRMTR